MVNKVIEIFSSILIWIGSGMVELGMKYRPMMEEPMSDSESDGYDISQEAYMRRRKTAGLRPEVLDESSLILK